MSREKHCKHTQPYQKIATTHPSEYSEHSATANTHREFLLRLMTDFRSGQQQYTELQHFLLGLRGSA